MPEKIKKRPCGICREWFTPNNKLKERQQTCGKPECKKKWHKESVLNSIRKIAMTANDRWIL